MVVVQMVSKEIAHWHPMHLVAGFAQLLGWEVQIGVRIEHQPRHQSFSHRTFFRSLSFTGAKPKSL
jgi:hypothetical protein